MMRRKIIPYKPHLKELARELRKNSTLTEIMLWNELKRKKVRGFDFDRQRPIDNYIVDFYCKDLQLAIEIDGESHYGNEDADEERQKRLESLGVRFLRFDDFDVRFKLDKVVSDIEKWIDENK
ncbi:MAG: endonuclease domain-containing protein [Bacteroidetes bacterium]|nr:endonuclease domain-containing protein [Bacteroidota bacterium]